jgi:hypothetical protein
MVAITEKDMNWYNIVNKSKKYWIRTELSVYWVLTIRFQLATVYN